MIFEQNLNFSGKILDKTDIFQKKLDTNHTIIYGHYMNVKDTGRYHIWSLKYLYISEFWQKSWTVQEKTGCMVTLIIH